MSRDDHDLTPCERCGELRSDTCTDCVIKHEMNGCLGKPHPVPAPLPANKARYSRDIGTATKVRPK